MISQVPGSTVVVLVVSVVVVTFDTVVVVVVTGMQATWQLVQVLPWELTNVHLGAWQAVQVSEETLPMAGTPS